MREKVHLDPSALRLSIPRTMETSFLQDAVLIFSGSNFMNDRAKNLSFAFLGTWNSIKCCFASEILQVHIHMSNASGKVSVSGYITERKMWPTWISRNTERSWFYIKRMP